MLYAIRQNSSFFYHNWFLILILLTGCQTRYEYSDDPPPLVITAPTHPIRLALVLGAGGVRGIAHVGVLEEFERAGIPIDVIVGCSAGSIVGALYADCADAKRVKQIMTPMRKWDILDINLFKARYGLVQGGALTRFMRRELRCKEFCDLKIPLYVVATDLIAGKLVCIHTGPIVPAIRASSSVPFVFCPALHCERVLVDGGVVNPVPVEIAQELGANIIVAVDLCTLLPDTCPTNLFGVVSRSAEIQFLKQTEGCLQGADIVIRPHLGDIGTFDDEFNESIYQAGRAAAREAIPKIWEALSQRECKLQN